MRSAPQKQPRPKSACCKPDGNGGFRGRALTKCFSGTGSAAERPGNASSGFGISDFFLAKANIADLPAAVDCGITQIDVNRHKMLLPATIDKRPSTPREPVPA